MPPLDLTNLTDAVAKTEGVAASAKVLIQEFAKEVAANANDPTALQMLVDRMNAAADDLASAVAANPDPNPND